MKIKQIAAGALAVIGIGTFTVFGLTKNDVDNEVSASSVMEESIVNEVNSEIISQEESQITDSDQSETVVESQVTSSAEASSTDSVASKATTESESQSVSSRKIINEFTTSWAHVIQWENEDVCVEHSRPSAASRPR